MADRLPVGDKFSQTDVIVLHPFVLVDPHAGFGHLLESVQLIGVHPDDVIGVDQATGERIRGFPDSVVEECPGSEVAPRQRAHWWTFRQVLVLGFADLLRERPHFRELGDVLHKDRGDVVNEVVGGVTRVHRVSDHLLDVGRLGGRLASFAALGQQDVRRHRLQLHVQLLANLAHAHRASVMLPKLPVYLVYRELLRVELAADPLLHIGVVFMFRVGHRLQEVGVAPDISPHRLR